MSGKKLGSSGPSLPKESASATSFQLTPSQKEAVNPFISVWVEASAGSGKTKVLVDRLLTLMVTGADPERLLCVTFTKAAATEMTQRLKKRLMAWSLLDRAALKEELRCLGLEPTEDLCQKAARLFHTILALPRGIRIQTLHSFAESFLRSFPLEAGVFPYFTVMDEAKSQEVWHQAMQHVFAKPNKSLKSHVALLIESFSESGFYQVFHDLKAMRSRLRQGGDDASIWLASARALLAIDKQQDRQSLIKTFLSQTPFNRYAFWCDHLAKISQAGRLPQLVEKMTAFLREGKPTAKAALPFGKDDPLLSGSPSVSHAPQNHFPQWFEAMRDVWLTRDGSPRKGVVAKKDLPRSFIQLEEPPCNTHHQHDTASQQGVGNEADKSQDFFQFVADEQKRWVAFLLAHQRLDAFHTTHALIACGVQVLKRYAALKQQDNALDYDDLLMKAANLLDQDEGWVRYKMDRGLDHILIDEAQDTSLAGWHLIEGLMEVFFVGDDARKTLFVVGDPKQSIYGFQGADPKLFSEMKKRFHHRIQALRRPFKALQLTTSFRSTPVILDLVDRVFDARDVYQGVSEAPLSHHPSDHLLKMGGTLALWPLSRDQKNDQNEVGHEATLADSAKEAFEGAMPRSDGHIGKANALKASHVSSGGQDGAGDPGALGVPVLSGRVRLAFNLALQIKMLVEKPLWLETKQRFCGPSDVMVLMRKRGPLIPLLVRFLKEMHVPVVGQDRLALQDALVIKDLLAFARFCLAPFDNLSLAEVLKGPWGGFSEEALMAIALDRGEKSLWQNLCASEKADCRDKAAWLKGWIERAKWSTPLDFFKHLLWHEDGLRIAAQRLGHEIYDVAEEFLIFLEHLQEEGHFSLQNTVHLFEKRSVTIKRDIASEGDGVRLMTVHGAKGLEAPCVILPDAPNKGKPYAAFVWIRSGDAWIPIDAQKVPKDLQEGVRLDEDEEYRRLLYVALTRSSEHLFVAGALASEASDKSWYGLVARGMKSMKAPSHEGNETFLPADFFLHQCGAQMESVAAKALEGGLLFGEEHQESQKAPTKKSVVPQRPLWAQTPWQGFEGLSFQSPTASKTDRLDQGEEIEGTTSHLAQKFSEETSDKLSPAQRQKTGNKRAVPRQDGHPVAFGQARFLKDFQALRGEGIHRLLEVFPLHKREMWDRLAKPCLESLGISDGLHGEILREVRSVLEASHLAFLHDPRALREVPFCSVQAGEGQARQDLSPDEELFFKDGEGFQVNESPKSKARLSNSMIVRGRLDFLLPLEEEVWILDYKSDRKPRLPLPQDYAQQLGLYARAVEKIFKKPVYAGLVWTRTSKVSWLQAPPSKVWAL